MAAKKKPIEVKDAAALGLDATALAAADQERDALELPPARPAVSMIEGDAATQAQGAAAAAPRRSEGHLMAAILTFAEHRDGKLRRAVAGGGLARRAGWPTRSGARRGGRCSSGTAMTRLAAELASYGADAGARLRRRRASAPTPPSRTRGPWSQVVRAAKPAVVLVPVHGHGQGPGAAGGGAKLGAGPRFRLRGASTSRTAAWWRGGRSTRARPTAR